MKRRLLCTLLCAVLLMGAAFPVMAVDVQAAETPESRLSPATPTRYGGTMLSGNARYVYDCLAEGVLRSDPLETIQLDEARAVSMEEVRCGVAVFLGDFPECFWMHNSYRYGSRSEGTVVVSISPNYSFTGEALTAAKEELDAVVDTILADLPEASNYEKALYLHDVLASRVDYELVGEHQTAYGALVNGRAVCAGYAAAYQLLLLEAGIEACTVTGVSYDPTTGASVNHAWNLVWMDEDTCVYTDVTWDDQGDKLYRYYFNLSKEEIETDHVVSDYFTLPTCNHDDQSYFDRNAYTVTEQSSAEEVAAMFAPEQNGMRQATICYVGDVSFSVWLNQNLSDLYRALGGRPGAYNCDIDQLGKEIRITVTGNFPTATYAVELSLAGNMQTNGSTEQHVVIGEQMGSVVIRAAAGYYFPEDYATQTVGGITVTRLSYTQLSVQGVPTRDVSLTLEAPTAQAPAQTPTAELVATGADTGVLRGLEAGMKISRNGSVWVDVDSDDDFLLTSLNPCTLYVVRCGNGTTVADSKAQKITVSKADTPSVTVIQILHPDGTGKILTQQTHEYSTDGETWTPCNGTLNDVAAGTYYIRVKAKGETLASDAQTVTVHPYSVLPPTDIENGNGLSGDGGSSSVGDGGADASSSGGSTATKAGGCAAFTLHGSEGALILLCVAAGLLGKKKIFAK